MSKRKLTIQTSSGPAITITRRALRRDKLVYIACSNKPHKYQHGRSCIVYIGTTKTGASRIADSAAKKAREILINRGMKQLEFFVVGCAYRQNLETWRMLERALLLIFRQTYGQVPIGNTQGKKIKPKIEQKYFSRRRLESVIMKYERPR